MADKATITSSYRKQLCLMGAMFLFGASWFLYDGYVGYPYQQGIAREFARFKEEGRLSEWREHAQAKGWPDGTHGDPGKDHSEMDVFTQKIIGFGILPIALLYCFSFVRSFGKWIALEDSHIVTSWGQRMPLDAVTKLNKNRWKSKGIAVAYYQDGSKTKKLVLDDYKYTRDKISEMLIATEPHLEPGQIVGGEPEQLPENQDPPQIPSPGSEIQEGSETPGD